MLHTVICHLIVVFFFVFLLVNIDVSFVMMFLLMLMLLFNCVVFFCLMLNVSVGFILNSKCRCLSVWFAGVFGGYSEC